MESGGEGGVEVAIQHWEKFEFKYYMGYILVLWPVKSEIPFRRWCWLVRSVSWCRSQFLVKRARNRRWFIGRINRRLFVSFNQSDRWNAPMQGLECGRKVCSLEALRWFAVRQASSNVYLFIRLCTSRGTGGGLDLHGGPKRRWGGWAPVSAYK